MNEKVLMALLLVALPKLARTADSQWVLEQSTLTYHVSHALHQTEGVSHAARGKGACQAGQCNFLIAVQFPLVSVRTRLPESALASAVSLEHVKHWERFWEPVILTVWDARADVTHWECIQTVLEKKRRSKNIAVPLNKTAKIPLPARNTLDDVGVRRIRAKTKSRFARFEAEQDGARHLIKILEEELGARVEYDAQMGFLLIERAGSLKVVAFGKYASRLDKLSRMTGLSPKAVTESSFDLLKQIMEAFRDGNHIALKDTDGTLLNHWRTLDELQSHVDRQTEISDESEGDEAP